MSNHTLIRTLPQLILLFVTDQFRHDAFHPFITPNLYQMSLDNSMTFNNAYTSTPTCTPARASLLTGKSTRNHGMLGYSSSVNCNKYRTTLPNSLSQFGGYNTYTVGKNHYGYDPMTGLYNNHSFEHFMIYDASEGYRFNKNVTDDYSKYYQTIHPNQPDPLDVTCHHLGYNDWKSCPYGSPHEEEHPTMWTTRNALKYLQEFPFHKKKKKKRMFIKISYHRPHSPYDPPNRLYQKFIQLNDSSIIPNKRFVNNSSWDVKYINKTIMDDNAFMGDPGNDSAFRTRAGYLASVAFVDEGIGQIINYLQTMGLYNDTLIMWISDHGDMNGDHNLWRKGYPYEASSRLRFILKLPTADDNKISDDLSIKYTYSETSHGHNIVRGKTMEVDRHLEEESIRVLPRTNSALVEIRDVAVTVYDYIGILEKVQALDPLVNGKSLLPIVYGGNEVRSWLDLEHSRIYRDDIHWNAIVGTYHDLDDDVNVKSLLLLWKYIFHVYDGSEQLFCITNDPNETYDISKVKPIMLEHWRNTMIQQFQDEGRGEMWVRNGHLVIRRQPMTYGQNYPCAY